MKFAEIEYYIKEIANHEFADRDLELQKVVTQIKQEMNARNLLPSTITLQKISEFFGEEFKYRCNYTKDLLLNAIDKLSHKEIKDPVGRAMTLYQEISIKEKNKITAFYKQHCEAICKLLSSNMPVEIESIMNDVAERSLRKNNTIIQFEYDSVVNKKENEQIIFLKPNFMGTGIDVRALWEKIKI